MKTETEKKLRNYFINFRMHSGEEYNATIKNSLLDEKDLTEVYGSILNTEGVVKIETSMDELVYTRSNHIAEIVVSSYEVGFVQQFMKGESQ